MGYGSPVWVGANGCRQPHRRARPAGYDLAFYNETLAEGSADRKPIPYNNAVGHLGHEFGHRWSAYARAKLGGKILHSVPGPLGSRPRDAMSHIYSLLIEASTLGGGAWQDNYDGTYTQLRDGYFVPASGYSYLDLYLMGFICRRSAGLLSADEPCAGRRGRQRAGHLQGRPDEAYHPGCDCRGRRRSLISTIPRDNLIQGLLWCGARQDSDNRTLGTCRRHSARMGELLGNCNRPPCVMTTNQR